MLFALEEQTYVAKENKQKYAAVLGKGEEDKGGGKGGFINI